MSEYGDQIIVKRNKSDKPNAPLFRAEINIGGQKYKASLWVWTRKDGSEVLDKNGEKQLKGKVEVDNYQPGGGEQQKPAERKPATEPPTDDIPF